jgi:hypothetical protein
MLGRNWSQSLTTLRFIYVYFFIILLAIFSAQFFIEGLQNKLNKHTHIYIYIMFVGFLHYQVLV